MILIYTDGGALGNPGPGGWGAIVATPDGQVVELGGGEAHTTNNRMELSGPIAALERVRGVPGPVTVFSDSQYVVKGISQWVHGWKRKGWKTASGSPVLNREYWEKLDRLVAERGRENAVHWQHVFGHTGVPGNERVDEIANAFASGYRPKLYQGPLAAYPVRLDAPAPSAAPPSPVLWERGGGGERVPGGAKGSAPRRSSQGKPYSYLSLVGGQPMRHANWAECERRVRGVSGARFRKAMSAEEEAEILRAWGCSLPPPGA